MKVVQQVLDERLQRTVTFNEMQVGCLPEKGTSDAVFSMSLPEECCVNKKNYMCFVNPLTEYHGKCWNRQ